MTEMNKKNKEAQDAVKEALESLNQGDKIFLRNQLDMKYTEILSSEDFILTVALWKKRGGGTTEWNLVLNMTDTQIAEELGFDASDLEASAE